MSETAMTDVHYQELLEDSRAYFKFYYPPCACAVLPEFSLSDLWMIWEWIRTQRDHDTDHPFYTEKLMTRVLPYTGNFVSARYEYLNDAQISGTLLAMQTQLQAEMESKHAKSH